ncbi:MAG: beta-aspartyl-peptidase [Cloacibacillus sp.]
MLLIRNADLYAPEAMGICDILAEGPEIIKVTPAGEISPALIKEAGVPLQLIDAKGALTMPGILDQHIHINGAGGEGGPINRTPPVRLSSLIEGGVTSVVGLLGTDGICRSIEELLMKARALEAEGVSTWIHTGSYSLPSVTITESVRRDICLVDKVIGVKLALGDHRGSYPTRDELRRIASDARVAGILSGKAGVVCLHMGSDADAFSLITEALAATNIPLSQFLPTHVTRNPKMLEQAAQYARDGGYIDITAHTADDSSNGVKSAAAIAYLKETGTPLSHVTLSSDGNGSLPRFNAAGELESISAAPVNSVLKIIRELIINKSVSIADAVSLATANAASRLSIKDKGSVRAGFSCDLLILDDALSLRYVISKGKIMMEEGVTVVKGRFE